MRINVVLAPVYNTHSMSYIIQTRWRRIIQYFNWPVIFIFIFFFFSGKILSFSLWTWTRAYVDEAREQWQRICRLSGALYIVVRNKSRVVIKGKKSGRRRRGCGRRLLSGRVAPSRGQGKCSVVVQSGWMKIYGARTTEFQSGAAAEGCSGFGSLRPAAAAECFL